jgi:hypothetical protein
MSFTIGFSDTSLHMHAQLNCQHIFVGSGHWPLQCFDGSCDTRNASSVWRGAAEGAYELKKNATAATLAPHPNPAPSMTLQQLSGRCALCFARVKLIDFGSF